MMNIKQKLSALLKLVLGMATLTVMLAACSGGGSSSSGGGTVSGVATPSKVSVVNTN